MLVINQKLSFLQIGENKEIVIEKSVLPCSEQTSVNVGGILEIFAEQISENGQVHKGKVGY